MRLARPVGVLVTTVVLVLATVLAGVLSLPAHAAAPAAERSGKPHHDLVAKGYEKGSSDRFFVKGKVPTFPKGRVRVLRSVDGGRFEVYKRVRTRSSGRFKTRIYQVDHDKTCFKVRVPGTASYRRTTSPSLGCITDN